MRRVKLDDDGCSVNFDHIVAVERKDGRVLAWLVSGTNLYLQDVYPVAHDLFRLSKDVWVNPQYVSTVGLGYNKDAAFKDVLDGVDRDNDYYKQIAVETVLGRDRTLWAGYYELDELDNLAELLLGGIEHG